VTIGLGNVSPWCVGDPSGESMTSSATLPSGIDIGVVMASASNCTDVTDFEQSQKRLKNCRNDVSGKKQENRNFNKMVCERETN
jgi:hypothetical protein